MKLEDIRREYMEGGLDIDQLDPSPFIQFESWMKQTIESNGFADPTAMNVATVSKEGQPSQRIVLLKHFDERGFVFYTNLGSRKAQEIADNPKVCLHFPWQSLGRQVIVYGVAEKLSTKEVAEYFLSRPKDSQLGAWASKQSKKIESKQMLMQMFSQVKEKFSKGQVPVPDFWGGYRVIPNAIEFWQGGEHRIHDRFMYTLSEDGQWRIDRLQP